MTIYILFFIILLLCCLNEKLLCNKRLRLILYSALFIFLCMGYMTGSDWRPYELWYNKLFSLKDVYDYNKEKGFAFIMYIMHFIGIDFWYFWIFLKVICLFVTLKTFRSFLGFESSWVLLVFYGYFALFYYIDNPMRNLLAACIFLVSISSILERKFWKFIFQILLASTIHFSVLFFIPCYFLGKKKAISKRWMFLSVIFIYTITLIVISTGALSDINNILQIMFGDEYRGSGYVDEEKSAGLSLGMSFFVLIFFYTNMYRERYMNRIHNMDLIINMSYLYIIFQALGMMIPMLWRFTMYLSVPFAISLMLPIYYEKNILKKYIIRTSMVFFLFIVMIKCIQSSAVYVPYSNYLEYTFKDHPDFSYREDFNPKNSPYSKGGETYY